MRACVRGCVRGCRSKVSRQDTQDKDVHSALPTTTHCLCPCAFAPLTPQSLSQVKLERSVGNHGDVRAVPTGDRGGALTTSQAASRNGDSPVSGGSQSGAVHGRREETPEERTGVRAPFSDNERANGRDRTRDAGSIEDDEGRQGGMGGGHGRDTERKRVRAVGLLRGQSARKEEFIRGERRERKDSRLDKMPETSSQTSVVPSERGRAIGDTSLDRLFGIAVFFTVNSLEIRFSIKLS